MYYLNCDYNEGAHPSILRALSDANFEQDSNYGADSHCKNARKLLLNEIFSCGDLPCAHGADDFSVDIHFTVGGTQTNLLVISAALRSYQGVLCATSGHINVHESGAIEATGHKVMALPSADGKISASQIDEAVAAHYADETAEHMVQPKLVYISQPTELGTLYTRDELYAIHEVCARRGLYLYMDGARLGYGLAADKTLALRDYAICCDAFYIGGTKVGALFGEAVVIRNDMLKPDFRTVMKQHGALLAKGQLLGIQFETLFTDGLYMKISEHALRLAMEVKAVCRDAGIEMLVDSPTNQQFPIFTDALLARLEKDYKFAFWTKTDENHTAVRICTSWASDEKEIEKLCSLIRGCV